MLKVKKPSAVSAPKSPFRSKQAFVTGSAEPESGWTPGQRQDEAPVTPGAKVSPVQVAGAIAALRKKKSSSPFGG